VLEPWRGVEEESAPIGTTTIEPASDVGPKETGGITPTIVNGTRSRSASAHGIGAPPKRLPEAVADHRHGAIRSAATHIVRRRKRPHSIAGPRERVDIPAVAQMPWTNSRRRHW